MQSSFGPSREMLENRHRENKAVDAVNKVHEEEEAKPKSEIVKLPATVVSDLYGQVSFDEFKDRYASIWQQITDKDHLITGRIQYTSKIMKTDLTVQSLSRREQTALSLFDPLFGTASSSAPEVRKDISAYRVILQLIKLGSTVFNKVTLNPDTRLTWAADPAIKQQYEYILDLDPIYFHYILSLLNDLDQAKQLALLENLKNP